MKQHALVVSRMKQFLLAVLWTLVLDVISRQKEYNHYESSSCFRGVHGYPISSLPQKGSIPASSLGKSKPLEKSKILSFGRPTAFVSNKEKKQIRQRSNGITSSTRAKLWRISQICSEIMEKNVSATTEEEDLSCGAVDNNNSPRTLLMKALNQLAAATSEAEILEAGRLLESSSCRGLILRDYNNATVNNNELGDYVIRATALTGLVQLAVNLTNHMLINDGNLISLQTQDAVSTCLRRAGRLSRLEELLSRLGEVAEQQTTSFATVSTHSFNIFLAALCEAATEKSVNIDSRAKEPPSIQRYTTLTQTELLQKAWYWLEGDRAKRVFKVSPDSVSYATVMQAAAAVGNITLARQIWDETINNEVQPNIVAYNSRLSIAGKYKSIHKKNKETLLIWEEIKNDSTVKPDKYTIDLVLVALAKEGRMDELKSLIDQFIFDSSSESSVSDSFAAFLLTVTKECDPKMMIVARDLFDTYISSSFSPVLFGNAGTIMRLVRPTTRHLNIMIDGYRNVASKTENVTESTFAYSQGWELYRLMLESPGSVSPDPFTITSMMGFCQTSQELAELCKQSLIEIGLPCTPAMLRALMSAYGSLGDASSAVWMFSNYFAAPESSSNTKLRTWNVLLGALGRGSKFNSTFPLDIYASTAAKSLDAFKNATSLSASSGLVRAVDGLTNDDAIIVLLNLMNEENNAGDKLFQPPRPDSQSYCVAAAALQYGPNKACQAMDLFRNATAAKNYADGRFINAVFRCFGDDIDSAISAWKSEIRNAVATYEKRPRKMASSMHKAGKKNLIAAYNGLLYVCGRALKPDIAVRIVYAMNKEGLEPGETSLNCYRSGKRDRENLIGEASRSSFAESFKLFAPYESLLYVECTKYDRNDRRRAGEKRVRIIL